jgi:UDP-glucose 4-epimerase
MIIEGKKVLVTGAAGFIGSHLVDRLLEMKCEVIGIDNLSSGKKEFLKNAMKKKRFRFVKYDLLEDEGLEEYMDGVNIVFHLAANPDVRIGASDTSVHLEQNVIATYVVLEAMRAMGVPVMAFTSTSTVYGEAEKVPTPENYGPLMPISLYGGSKLAAEAMISAYAHTFDMRAVLYRFANVVGPRSTHGVIHDFVEKLRKNPDELEILGAEPGTRKSYVHIDDTIEGIIHGVHVSMDRVSI